MKLFRKYFLLIAVLATGAASGQVKTGTPPFGSFGDGPFDTVNLGNLNVHFSIPVLHKAGRGVPFAYDLSYDSSVWTPVTSSGTTQWSPDSNWGWRGTTEAAVGYVSQTATQTLCKYFRNGRWQQYYYTVWYTYGYGDQFGVFHPSNTTLNRIDVFDATQQTQISSIIVPEPWRMDVAPDGSKLYVATTFGDVYIIDPGVMKIVQRNPSSTIGPQGYTATQVFMLSDGQLALLGALGGFYFDGSTDFAIWNPTTNAVSILRAELPNFGPNIGQITLTADRSKVILGGATVQYVELYDPSTGTAISQNVTCGQVEEILPTADGKRIIVVGLGGNVDVLDPSTLAELGSFPNVPGDSAVLSHDGSTLYTVDFQANVLAWDSTTASEQRSFSAAGI